MTLYELTERDQANLSWMIRCNDEYGCGYLGPTVKRFGRIQECETLVQSGLARCSDRASAKARGYFITSEGRAALQRA